MYMRDKKIYAGTCAGGLTCEGGGIIAGFYSNSSHVRCKIKLQRKLVSMHSYFLPTVQVRVT